jgi:hypothetical protein
MFHPVIAVREGGGISDSFSVTTLMFTTLGDV